MNVHLKISVKSVTLSWHLIWTHRNAPENQTRCVHLELLITHSKHIAKNKVEV